LRSRLVVIASNLNAGGLGLRNHSFARCSPDHVLPAAHSSSGAAGKSRAWRRPFFGAKDGERACNRGCRSDCDRRPIGCRRRGFTGGCGQSSVGGAAANQMAEPSPCSAARWKTGARARLIRTGRQLASPLDGWVTASATRQPGYYECAREMKAVHICSWD